MILTKRNGGNATITEVADIWKEFAEACRKEGGAPFPLSTDPSDDWIKSYWHQWLNYENKDGGV